jgi:hypothetical protein
MEGMMSTHITIAGTSAGRFDLLRGGSELVDLSLLAARTAVVLQQVSRGEPLSDEDEQILQMMAQLLSDAAHAFQFFGSGGKEGAPTSGALAAQVDAAIDAVLDEPDHPVDPAVLTRRLLEVSQRLRSAHEPWSADEAHRLSGFFSVLARSVLNQTGHVGELTATL